MAKIFKSVGWRSQPPLIIRDQSGSTLVEAALIFPMLILLGLVTLDFSNWFFEHQAMTTGVRDAARYAARMNPSNGSVPTFAQNIACYGQPATGSKLRVPGCTVSVVYSDVAAGTYRGPPTIPLKYVTVSASYNYSGFGWLQTFGFNTNNAIKMDVSHSERVIGG